MTRILVIGAGAAGISAARSLDGQGHEVVVLEARDRVGGRAFTDYTIAGHAVELGAEFIHGEHVATWSWVRQFGAATSGEAHSYTQYYHLDEGLLTTPDLVARVGTDPYGAVQRLTEAWIGADAPDATVANVVDTWPTHYGRSLGVRERRLIDNMIAETTAADAEDLSAYRGSEATYAGDGRWRHFRLRDGYSQLMAAAAARLDIRTGHPVTRLRWDAANVELTTTAGVHRADRCVVAVPLGVLQRDAIEFDPPLPPAKRRAIATLNAGHINKVVLRLDRVYWPPDLTFLWTAADTQLWWRPGQGQAAEAPVITAFFGGRGAARWEALSQADAIDAAAAQLGDMLGESLAGKVMDGRFIAWGAEPHTWMGYSSVPPGGRGQRAHLATPVGALVFAGEATSVLRPATVHGAIESGLRAATEVLASLRANER